MINFQNEIIKLIRKQFNNNAQKLTFEVAYNSLKSNSKFWEYIQQPNTYAVEVQRFIPVIVDELSGSFAELQDVEGAEFFLSTSIMLPTDAFSPSNNVNEDTFTEVIQTLNKISRDTRANVYVLGEKRWILPDDYRLTLDISQLATEGFEFDVEFNDVLNGDLIKFDNQTLATLNGNIVQAGGGILLSNYELNKKYRIRVVKNISDYTMFINGVPILTTIINFIAGNSVIIGGNFFKAYQFKALDADGLTLLSVTDFNLPTLNKVGAKAVLEGSEGKVTLNFSLPQRVSEQFTLGDGLNYQLYEFNANGFYTDKMLLGQEIEYYIDGVRVFPIFRAESFLGEADMARYLGKNQVNKSVIEQVGIAKEYTLYYQPKAKIIELMKHISSENVEANKIYTLKIVYPFFEREHRVLITQGGLSVVNSVPIGVSFSMDIADEQVLTQVG